MSNITYFNTYFAHELSEKEWNNDINKHNAMYFNLKDNDILTQDTFTNLKDNNYNFWIKVINDNPLYKQGCYLVELTLTYINKPITLYVNKELLVWKISSVINALSYYLKLTIKALYKSNVLNVSTSTNTPIKLNTLRTS